MTNRKRSLRVILNGVNGRSFHLVVPPAIDTLAELCCFITDEVPLPGPVGSSSGIQSRSFRFLYSTTGEPLWRVSECLELGTIVVSERAGFQFRDASPDPREVQTAGSSNSEPLLGSRQRGSASPIPIRPTPKPPLQHLVDSSGLVEASVEWGKSHRENSDGNQPSTAAQTGVPRRRSVTFSPAEKSPAVHEWNSTSAELLLSRKWKAFQFVRRCDHLLGKAEVRDRLESVALQRKALSPGTPLRVVVSGPPGSGVSTTAAMFVQEIFFKGDSNPVSRGNAFRGHLLLPLDLSIILSDHDQFMEEPSAFFLCESVLHAAFDAATVGRRTLKMSVTTLVDFWMSTLCPTISREEALYIRKEAVSVVGEEVVRNWEVFATPVGALLREAMIHAHDLHLRDEVLQLVFRDVAVEIARALGFVGVFYLLDGLELLLVAGTPTTISRPLGDVSAILHALCDPERTPHIHVILAFSSSSSHSIELSYIPGLSSWIKTVGLLKRDAKDSQFPDHLHSFAQTFPMDIFLWAPGYLSVVQRFGKVIANEKNEPKCLRFDFPEVERALEALHQQVHGE